MGDVKQIDEVWHAVAPLAGWGSEGAGWQHFLISSLLVLIRMSGLVLFAPIFSSAAIAPRIKASFVIAVTILLGPVVASLPHARVVLDAQSVLGELSVGLTFGIALSLLNESLMFAGQLLGMQFSFSLVNLLDPNSMIETPVLGQLLGWVGILVLIGTGLDRSMLAAVMRSFSVVPVGDAVMKATTGIALTEMVGGVFFAGLQLAAPVMAAAMTVEVAVGLVGKISPQLPSMVLSIPLKTLVAYAVLIGSLSIWPGWIEHHFSALLDSALRLVSR